MATDLHVKIQKKLHDLKVIPAWNAIQKHRVKGNTVFGPTIRRHFKNTPEHNFEDITLETVTQNVIPILYFFEKHCCDSNTVLVLPSKAVF